MSRDWSPRECWAVHLHDKDLFFSNIEIIVDGKSRGMWFTDEELEDRKTHKYVAVLCGGIYKKLRETITDDAFENLNRTLGELVDADFGGKGTSQFPSEMTTWYFNLKNHYYREPNNEEFLEYILGNAELK